MTTLYKPDVQLRIIREYCTDAHHNRIVLAAKLVCQAARCLSADPLRITGSRCNTAVEGLRELHRYERSRDVM